MAFNLSRNPRFTATRRPALAIFALLLAAALAQTGCSLLNSQVVAKVGTRTLTLREYQLMLRDASGGVAPPDSIRRQLMVEDWADRQLLFLEAESQKLDTIPTVASALKEQLDPLAVEEIYRQEVLSKVKVTEADVKKLYDRRKESRVLARILVATQAEADSLKREITKGMPFEQAAFMKSMDRSSAANGGLAGEVLPGDLPTEIETEVWRLKPGEVSNPVRSQGGFDLIKLMEIKPAKPRPYEQEKVGLEAGLRNRQQYDATVALLDNLKKQRNMLIVDEDVRALTEKMVQAARVADTIPPFTPTERSAPLARYQGGPYTVGELLDDVQKSGGQQRPNLTDQRQIRQFVENRAGLRILADEARARGLDKAPRVVKQAARRRDNLMAQVLVSRVLGAPHEATDAELRTEFQQHLGEYVNEGNASVYRISTPDPHGAEEAAREARANVDFPGLQRRFAHPTPDELKSGPETQIYFDGTRPALADSLRGRSPDAIIGPVSENGRYYVYKVRAVYPPLHTAFEEARGTLMQRVRLAVENHMLRDHIDQLKKRWPPSINNKVVQSAAPAPPAKPGEDDAS